MVMVGQRYRNWQEAGVSKDNQETLRNYLKTKIRRALGDWVTLGDSSPKPPDAIISRQGEGRFKF